MCVDWLRTASPCSKDRDRATDGVTHQSSASPSDVSGVGFGLSQCEECPPWPPGSQLTSYGNPGPQFKKKPTTYFTKSTNREKQVPPGPCQLSQLASKADVIGCSAYSRRRSSG